MALNKCKECDNHVSSKAKTCPHCGAPVKKSCRGALLFIIFFVGFACIMSMCDYPSPSKPPTNRNISNGNKVLDIRIPTDNVDIKDNDIRTGPGMNYANDETGSLMKDEKLYMLDEKNGWIKFRVTSQDEGWSAWVEKSLTISLKEVQAAREAKFGKAPSPSSWDGSVRCVEGYLTKTLKDPDSLKFEQWSNVYYNDDAGWTVKCDFRAKNSFGAYERYVKWFVIQHGSVVDVKEFNKSKEE